MKNLKAIMIFMTIFMALLVMPSAVFAETNCNAVNTEADLKACLEAGESVKLTGDIEITTKTTNTPTTGRTVGINISGDGEIVIDGDGHTISTESVRVLFEVRATAANTHVKFVNVKLDSQNQSYARVIDTRTNNLELTLEKVTMTAGGTGNSQGITIGGPQGPVVLNVVDSTIDVGTAGYGIITFNKVIATVENSTIEGYAALYLKGADGSEGSEGSVIEVLGSKLVGKNASSGESNEFGVIALGDDNITIAIVDSEVVAKSTGDQPQNLIAYEFGNFTPTEEIKVNITGDSKIIVDNDVTEEKFVSEDNDKLNLTVGSGVESNIEVKEEYLEEGSKAVETENGVVVSKENTITVLTYENGTITVSKTKAYLNEVITVTVTPKDGYKVKTFGAETATGGEITITDGKFTMPNEAVVVGAEFEKVAAPVVPVEPPVKNPETGDINLVAVMSMLTLGLVGLGYTVKKRFN